MKKQNIIYSAISIFCLFLLVIIGLFSDCIRITDTNMPSVYIIDGLTGLYVMLAGVLAETLVLKPFFKSTYLKSLTIVSGMNLVSLISGFIVIHMAGFIAEVFFILFNCSIFHVAGWIADFVLIVILNSALEGLIIKAAFRYELSKTFKWLCLANTASILICFLFNLSWVAEMVF